MDLNEQVVVYKRASINDLLLFGRMITRQISITSFPYMCGMERARKAFIERFIRDGTEGVCLIALCDGFVVGWIAGEPITYAFADEPMFSVVAWDVDPEYGNRGIGQGLMTRIMQHAYNLGIYMFIVGVNHNASPYPDRAYQALLRRGFAEFERTFVTDLRSQFGPPPAEPTKKVT